jgi:hypothetical protein
MISYDACIGLSCVFNWRLCCRKIFILNLSVVMTNFKK